MRLFRPLDLIIEALVDYLVDRFIGSGLWTGTVYGRTRSRPPSALLCVPEQTEKPMVMSVYPITKSGNNFAFHLRTLSK